MADEIVRRVTVTATGQSSVDALSNSLKGLSGETTALAQVTDTSAKRALSAEAAYQKQTLALDPAARAQAAIAKATKTANDALAQGIITQDDHAKRVSAITEKYTTQVGAGAALGKATQALQLQMASLAGGLGLTGSVLTAFGPWGFAAAIGLGALSSAFSLASDKSHELAQKSKEIFEFSEATGLTTTQFQALRSEAGKFGIDSETLASGLSKFTVGFQELRLGSGKLLEDINKINPALALQMQSTTESATAFTLFGRAVAQTSDIFERNALLKAGLGKGAAQYGAFFASSPDISGLAAAAKEAGRGIDQELIEKLKQLEIDIRRTKSAADTVFAKMFGSSSLEGELQFQKGILEIAKTISGFTLSSDMTKFIDFMTSPATLLVLAGLATAAAVASGGTLLAVGGAAIGAAGVYGAVKQTGAESDSGSNFNDRYGTYAKKVDEGPIGPNNDSKLTLEATAAAAKNLVAVLGSAASPAQKLDAAIKQLNVTAKAAGVSENDLARGIAGLKLDNAIAVQSAHNSAMGAAATTTDLLAAKTLELARANQNGANLSKDQIENAKRLTVEQSLGTYAINSQIDSEKIRLATIGMTNQAALSYSTSQSILNKATQDGKTLTEAEIVAIKSKADAYAAIKIKVDQYSEIANVLKQSEEQFANDFVSGLVAGKSAMSSLGDAATNLSKQLTSGAIKSLLSGDLLSAGIQAVGAIVTGLFGNNQKKREEEAKAQQAALERAVDYANRLQLAGNDSSTQAGALLAFDVNANKERADEAKNGNRSIAALEAALSAERQAIVNDFATRALADQKAAEEAKIAAEKAAQDAALGRAKSYQDRLFNANIDTSTLDGALASFNKKALEEQSAEMDAGGTKITDLIAAQEAERFNIYKKFNDASLKSAIDVSASLKATLLATQQYIDTTIKTIKDYLNGLKTGSDSTLSPQERLNAAQSQFNTQMALAAVGDRTALSTITQYASTLLGAAKDYYASSSGYANVFDAVNNSLNKLPTTLTVSQVSAADAIVSAIQSAKSQSTTDINAATNATLTATYGTTGAVNYGVAVAANAANQSNELDAAQAALLASQNALSASQVSYLGTQVKLLDAISGLSANFAANLNVLGTLESNIGNTHTQQFGAMIGLLGTIATRPAPQQQTIWGWLGFQDGGKIPGYANGGIVGNGTYGVDSVRARYAGGGDIALAGGEFVTRAASVNSQTSKALNYINRTGNVPGNDNSDVVRVLADGFNGQTAVLSERLSAIEGRIKKLDDTTRQTVTPRRVTTAKAA